MDISIESIIRNEIRGVEDPISRLELIKKEIERQLSAERLLKSILGEEEYNNFLNKREISVTSKKYHNRYYLIRELGVIDVIENGVLKEKLCINPKESNFPLQDQLVAKKLGLEGAEEWILKTANHTTVSEISEFCKRIIKRFNLGFDPFIYKREESLKNIKENKINLGFDPFIDKKEESLKKVKNIKINLGFDPFIDRRMEF